MKKLLLFAALSGFFIPSFARQDTAYPKRIYSSTEISVPAKIDGWINEDMWDQVPWEGDFQMFEPYDDRPPTQETMKMKPISKESPGWVHLIGELHGLQEIDPKKQAEITPYAVAGSKWFEKDPEDPFLAEGNDLIFNAGLDAKFGITINFTVDLTVNPDFGQMEADPSEVNLTAFETFFEEQRPFFIEGKNIFHFDLAVHNMDNLFYSRRIGHRPHHNPELDDGEYARMPEFTKILGAAKVTGKTKSGLSVGIMESVTSREQAEIDQNGNRSLLTVEPLTNYHPRWDGHFHEPFQ